ncbi:MAG: Hsp20/alpha crystallin family protein [Rhodothermales bacterium]|nr:Hsp20/alpha crystallin family protein [Rhodothermales bacterium]
MTSLIRFSPTTEVRSLQREIDRMFDSFLPKANGDSEQAVWTPRVDLAESENAYLVHLDVPGMKKEDLEVNFQDGSVTVSGTRNEQTVGEDANFVRVERRFGRFYRSFDLPKTVDSSKIEATYEDGVLSIRIPKAEESKPKSVTIK